MHTRYILRNSNSLDDGAAVAKHTSAPCSPKATLYSFTRARAQHAAPPSPPQAVSELLAYLASEKNKGSKIDREDVEDLDEAARSVLQGIDDFLKLAPSEDVLMAADQARAQAARPKKAAPTEAAPTAVAVGGRELEGAVVGEGAFVAGAWVGKQ